MGKLVPATQDELQSMLTEMGYTSIRELYANVPEEVYLEQVDIDSGKSELEVTNEMNRLAEANVRFQELLSRCGCLPSLYSCNRNCNNGEGRICHFLYSLSG